MPGRPEREYEILESKMNDKTFPRRQLLVIPGTVRFAMNPRNTTSHCQSHRERHCTQKDKFVLRYPIEQQSRLGIRIRALSSPQSTGVPEAYDREYYKRVNCPVNSIKDQYHDILEDVLAIFLRKGLHIRRSTSHFPNIQEDAVFRPGRHWQGKKYVKNDQTRTSRCKSKGCPYN
ncbi:hypothetical protein BJ508DRAFT_303810 [Ascobolus immersus RN42]|uniref:Uncharacterized protein n=1 Tax=Ascobolus immersus RN42 TaxID=1160509 RepID=A0A3N4IRV3_ASCIM|nr:hypothetical protein BJ508DRAFT_303810 [Ascobolus immersus RN42]